jgi:hypothetical protein
VSKLENLEETNAKLIESKPQSMKRCDNGMLKKDTREPIATSARYFESKS